VETCSHRLAVVVGVNYPRCGSGPGGSCPGCQLSEVAVVRVAVVLGGNCPRWQLSHVAVVQVAVVQIPIAPYQNITHEDSQKSSTKIWEQFETGILIGMADRGW